MHILCAVKVSFFYHYFAHTIHKQNEKGKMSMKAYYNETADNVRRELNGTMDFMTDEEVKKRQEKK